MLERFTPEMYRTAYANKMSLSAWLETQDPSEGYNDGLDAFGRLLMAADIRVNSMPEIGVYASKFEAFDKTEHTSSSPRYPTVRRPTGDSVSAKGLPTPPAGGRRG
jgi:hypothetical protein